MKKRYLLLPVVMVLASCGTSKIVMDKVPTFEGGEVTPDVIKGKAEKYVDGYNEVKGLGFDVKINDFRVETTANLEFGEVTIPGKVESFTKGHLSGGGSWPR